MTQYNISEELNKIVENHKHFLNQDCNGWQTMRANLSGADLTYSCLNRVNLTNADLRFTNLINMHLKDTSLDNANLNGATLKSTIIEINKKLT